MKLTPLACLLAVHLAVCGDVAWSQSRIWKGLNGKSLKAEYGGIDGDKVLLRRDDRSVVRTSFANLSAADQDYVASRINATGVRAATGPTAAKPPAARKPRRSALLIAVNKYQHLPQLRYCERDVEDIKKRLAKLGFERIVVLRDSAKSPDLKPTLPNIKHWLTAFLEGRVDRSKGVRVIPRLVGPDDVIVFGFSGHGLMVDGQSYFCPPEAKVSDPRGTMVSADSVYQQLGQVSQGLRLMLIDACRNAPDGSTAKPFEVDRSLKNGLIGLASCSPGEFSLEDDTLRHGVFSYYLQAAFGGAASDQKNQSIEVRWNQIMSMTIDKTSQFAKTRLKRQQTPHYFGSVKGNPLIGVLSKDSVVTEQDLVPPEVVEKQSFRLDLAEVPVGAVPVGWRGNQQIATRTEKGVKVMLSGAGERQSVTSPPISFKQDFCVQFEVWGKGRLGVDLKHDDKTQPLSLDCGIQTWAAKLPDQQQVRANGVRRFTDRVLVAIRRISDRYQLVLNGQTYGTWRDGSGGELKQITLHFHDTGVMIPRFRVDRVVPPNGKAKPAVANAKNLTLVGADGEFKRQRFQTSPELPLEIQGPFQMQMDLARGQSQLGITLVGSGGALDIPLVIFNTGNHWRALMPFIDKQVAVRPTRMDVFQLTSQNGIIVLKHNQQDLGSFRDDEQAFGQYQSLLIDSYHGKHQQIKSLRIGPAAAAPAK